MASRGRVTLWGKRTVARVLLAPSDASRRYHKPAIEGGIAPFCATFKRGEPVSLDEAIEAGRRGCRTCWPVVLREDER